jgi:hypothetical protein
MEKVNIKKMSSKAFATLFTVILTALLFLGAGVGMNTNQINLPKSVGPWTRPDSARVINSKNIFDYMNGAGELYLGYRFDHLEVHEYSASEQDNILVELYFMDTSDDAFGLLSLDWGGELVSLSRSPGKKPAEAETSSARALYGEGLLRIWSDTLYARVMAYRETPESKKAVLSLGQAIIANRKNPPGPGLTKILSSQIDTDWTLRKDRMSFFRSYLVLNSIYYLSQQNILYLDHSTEAVSVNYEQAESTGDPIRVRFLLVKYKSSDRARKAMEYFHDAYLPEYKKERKTGLGAEMPGYFRVEDSWLGYQLQGEYFAVVFDCPDQESARMIIHQNILNVLKLEE